MPSHTQLFFVQLTEDNHLFIQWNRNSTLRNKDPNSILGDNQAVRSLKIPSFAPPPHSAEKRTKSCAKQKGLAKSIARYSFTGLNIIIFHDGLFNISYCHYDQ